MLLIHAGIVGDRFVLWGETPPQATEASGGKGRRSAASLPQSSPYDPGAENFWQQVAAAVPDLGLNRKNAPEMLQPVVWLPTVAGVPIPSSPIIAPLPEDVSACALTPWTVTGLPLTWEQATVLLCACVGRDTLGGGVFIGASLLYWATALRFAGALIARQQFLPDVEQDTDGYRAIWRPVLAGAEGDAFARLVQAMPGACRALSEEATAPPDLPAARLLTHLLTRLCDYLVRSSGSDVEADIPGIRAGKRTRKTRTPAFDSVHDAWLHALQTPDARISGEHADIAAFAAQVRDWKRPLFLSVAAPFRLCFRLEEPEIESDAEIAGAVWQVRYLLQSVEDPSLLLPVEKAWSGKGQVGALLRRDDFAPREFLLAALGQASRVCPEIEASLKSAAPGGYTLDTGGAQTFLMEKAWLLEQSGYVVLLPAWWSRKGTKQRLTAHASVKSPQMTSLAGLSLDTIVAFDWEVALGGEKLSYAELQALAQQKVALVRIRGQWVQLDSKEIETALAFWKRRKGQEASVREIVRMALGAETLGGGLPIEGVNASGWIGELLAQMEGQTTLGSLPAPVGFQGTLRPYQQRGYEWLHFLGQWGWGACLADDMGLGKTAQTLAYVRSGWERNGKKPVLVVCPTSVVGNWHREAQRFTPDLPVMVHHGLTRYKGEAFREQAEQQAIVLSSFALLHRDFEILKEVKWGGVILDEAQNIKNPETKQSKAARALTADWRIALTGTPVENHVGDLWSILEFLNPGLLGTQAEFRRNFYFPIQADHDPDAAERLKRITGPFILRRLKTDRSIIADLPEKLEMKVYCTLTSEQASLYEAVVKEMMEQVEEAEGMSRRGLVLATLMKLKQVCNHPAQFLGDNSPAPGRSGKLARLTEMLEEAVEAGDQALIFTQFTEMGEILRKHLQETFGKEVLFLHGGVVKKQRDRMVERFQTEGAALPFFLLSLKAGGVGLNLTAANHVFHYDRWWNPAVENQATDRAFRIGQKKNVQVHKFICAGTLEDKIDALIESKRAIAAQVVGSGEEWLTELSTDDLRALVTLQRDI